MDLSPKFRCEKFQCPHCHVASQQTWFNVDNASNSANKILNHVFYDYRTQIESYQQTAIADFIQRVEVANTEHMSEFVPTGFSVATCSICGEISLWVNKKIVYPRQTLIDPPNEDMEKEIQELYVEASNIVVDSSKGLQPC